jgi:predicted nucleic acid-binding protein
VIVLDTDVLIEILEKGSTRGDAALEEIRESGDDVAVTSVTVHEILHGARRRKVKLPGLEMMRTLDFTSDDARLGAKIEVDLEDAGLRVGRFDCMQAASVINRAGRFFTFNRKHFERMQGAGLKLF